MSSSGERGSPERSCTRPAHPGLLHDLATLLHLGPLQELVELVPLEAKPERFDARWGGVEARPFLVALRDFVQVSAAPSFFAQEREFCLTIGATGNMCVDHATRITVQARIHQVRQQVANIGVRTVIHRETP